MKKDYPLCIKVPDKQGNFTRVLKRCRFVDSRRAFYFEPKFYLSEKDDMIKRKDILYEDNEVIGPMSEGFKPCSLKDYRDYCRQQFRKYKDEEVFINPIAVAYGMVEPEYDDKAVTSPKYHI